MDEIANTILNRMKKHPSWEWKREDFCDIGNLRQISARLAALNNKGYVCKNSIYGRISFTLNLERG